MPALLLVLLALPGSARAGYACPVMQLENEFLAFVGDFARWNAQNDNMPLLALELTPAQDQGNMLLLLWWMWMLNPDLPPPPTPLGWNLPSPPVAPIVGPIGPPAGPPPGSGGPGSENGPSNPPGNGGGGSPISGSGGDGSPTPGPGNGNGGGTSPGGSHSGPGNSPPPPVTGVPEPSTLVLSSCGAIALLTYRCIRGRRPFRD
jgi:hypothetical protein